MNKFNIFIDGTTIFSTASSIIVRIGILLIFYTRKDKPRYVLLTPSVLVKQLIYDRHQKEWIKVFIRNAIDFGTMRRIYLLEEYSTSQFKRHEDVKSFYEHIIKIKKTPLIIDCGGNIGLASKYFSKNYNNSKILCIEPEKSNLLQARINNPSGDIDFIESAIGSKDGFGSILSKKVENNSYQISSSSDGEILITSINELLKKYDKNYYFPYILKIDIEGYESDLFSKNCEWINSFPIIIIELHDWMMPRGRTSFNFLNAIAPLDRDFLCLGENIFSISNQVDEVLATQ